MASTRAPTVLSIVASGTGITGGNGDLNAGHVVTLTVNMSEAVTVAGGTPTLTLNDGGTATYISGSGTSALVFSYTVANGQNSADLNVTAFHANSATITDGAGNAATMTGAVANPAGTLQIDTTAPSIAIGTIAADNTINAVEAAAGVAISGTTTGVEDGQTVTVAIVDGSNAVVDSYTATVSGNAWTLNVGSGDAQALADGSYTVKADVSDVAGNPAPQAAQGLTVDETAPSIAIGTIAADNTILLGQFCWIFSNPDAVNDISIYFTRQPAPVSHPKSVRHTA